MSKSSFISIAAIAFIVVLFGNSCKKIQEDFLVKGQWNLTTIKYDTLSENKIDAFLPNFNSTSRYTIDFQGNNIVQAYYFSNDTLAGFHIGSWKLLEYNKIYLNLDRFADGNFTFKRVGNRLYDLESQQNHIRAFDGIFPQLDTTYTLLELKRL